MTRDLLWLLGLIALFPALASAIAPVLVVAEPKSREAAVTATLFPEVEVVAPSGLGQHQSSLVGRKLLFVGTTALQNKSALPGIERAIAAAPKVMISSPLVLTLKALVEKESGGKVVALQTLNRAMQPGYAIQQINLVPNVNFGFPGDRFRLRGTLTLASRNPIFLGAPHCRPAMEIDIFEDQKVAADPEVVAAHYPLSLVCPRRSGRGSLILSGFEFADLETSSLNLERLRDFLWNLIR